MSKRNTDKFNFWLPLEIEKGNGDSDELIKINGIASSATEDSDGEILFPSGFDYSPFLKSGIINYNHQSSKTSKAIVGEPTHAEVINDGKDLYIEGVIYPNEEGKSIVEQQKIFEKYSPNRRFGFSIEGQAIERDELNPKKILKARLTGVAITCMPKNPNTLMSLVKGEYAEAYVDDEEDENDEEKAIDVAAIAPATPESVDHATKKVISKSQVYESIINTYKTSDFELIKNIYNFVKSVNAKMLGMENKEITKDTLNKAFELLDNISKGNAIGDISGTVENKDANTDTNTVVKSEDAEAMEFAKGMYAEGKTKDECVEGMVRKGYSLSVSQSTVESAIASANAEKEGGAVSAAPIMKAEDLQSITDSISKSLEDTIGQKFNPIQNQIEKGFGAVNDLFKAQGEETNLLKSQINELTERLKKVEDTPLPRKTMTHPGAIDRFQKSADGSPVQDGVRIVSVSNPDSKGALSDEMFEEFQKSKDASLGDAIQGLESANFLSPAMQKRFNVHLVP